MLKIPDRTIDQPSVPVESARTRKGAGPPTAIAPTDPNRRQPWPRRARMAVAALSVVALAGIAGTTIQTVRNADTTDETAQVVDERDQLTEANEALEIELTAAETRISTLSNDVAELDAANEELTVDLADQVAATATVVAERDTLAELFPLTVDPTLLGQDIVGTYGVTWMPAYNSGLADLVLPAVSQVTITETSEGWLQVDIPGVIRADLARTDGALFTIVDSTTAVPAVNGVERLARVAITVYAGDTTTALDGTTTVDQLGLSIAISTDAVGDVPAGVALYGAELTPQR